LKELLRLNSLRNNRPLEKQNNNKFSVLNVKDKFLKNTPGCANSFLLHFS